MVIGFNGMFSQAFAWRAIRSQPVVAPESTSTITFHSTEVFTAMPYVLTGELVEVPSSGDPFQLERFLPLRHGSQLRVAGDQG